MATPPRLRPSAYQRAKRIADRYLSRLSQLVSSPLVVEEHELAPVPIKAVCPVPTNLSMVPEGFLRFYQETFSQVAPDFRQVVYRLQNVNVAWHGTVLAGLRVFTPSLPGPEYEQEFTGLFLLRQLRSRRVAELADVPVGLVFNSWSGNYFHWIAEVLPRLAILRKIQPDCVVLLPGPKPPEYILRTVEAFGFQRTYIIMPGELVLVRQLWMPVRPGRAGYMAPSLVQEVREQIMSSLQIQLHSAVKASRWVYVSRSRQQWRQLTNEAEVVAILQRYGFETVYFEELSFVEQVRTMYETAIFIGIHGANMTNILFMTPGTHAIEMLSETYLNPSYLSMAASIGVLYSVVPSKLGSPPNVEHNYADITVDPASVEQVIRPLCKARYVATVPDNEVC